ncbi:MAG: inorganic phosphate transporter [Caulobacteraceae bacterium]|nr:inorganic phosphate transporter [Caulobacteraceae bacterium]
MTDAAIADGDRSQGGRASGVELDRKIHPGGVAAFGLLILAGIGFAAFNIFSDTSHVGETLAFAPFLFLGLALVIALGFEFVNGFHDTANAVATVIYTHSLPPVFAVIWSGCFNFLGVVVSTGAVAYSVITLLPVDLILNVGSAGGYAMIFALLIAAVVWNLGTWFLGLPNSSSHALIGSILGVGLANQLMSSGTGGTSGVEWSQARDVLLALLVSPIMGFVGAFLLLWLMKRVIKNDKLYQEPEGEKPPPPIIRGLLVFTCTAVSFAHGGNDGQKGMGLIMLILIGVAPTAYALNRTMPDSSTPAFAQATQAVAPVFAAHAQGQSVDPNQARAIVSDALRKHDVSQPQVFAALGAIAPQINQQVQTYGGVKHVPAAQTKNLRNDMYLVYDALRLATADKKKADQAFPNGGAKAVTGYRDLLEKGTRFIPTWVKITVALALGLGTMVGWKRIVITVGTRIGKMHLTYGMGASAELVAAATILLAQVKGMPVSTTHILSSGVAGAAAANGSGLQWGTVRNIAMAWILTLPAAMAIAGGLYFVFLHAVRAAGLN